MKNLTFTALLLIISIISYSQQELKQSFGIVGRANVSTFRHNNTLSGRDITVNPEIGVSWKIPFSPSIGLRIEGLYTETGSRYGTFDNTPRQYDLRLRYAKLPIMLYAKHRAFSFNLGYYEAYLLDKVTIGSWNHKNYSFYSSHWIANRSDRGLIGGINIYLNPITWTTLGTYGLRRIGNGYEKIPLWEERNVSVSTGILIKL